jgi:hypothetical protein
VFDKSIIKFWTCYNFIMKMLRICVYTCITGNYDNLSEIEFKEEDIDYLCFTNNKNLRSKSWEIVYLDDLSLDDLTLSRKIKILGHPIIHKNYDVSIWIDGAFSLRKKTSVFLTDCFNYEKCKIAVPVHHERKCVYEEITEVVKRRREIKENATRIRDFFESKGYGHNIGLFETGIIIRKHNLKEVKKTMRTWFSMILKYSKRDQISFPYSVKTNNLEVCPININVFDNEYFQWNLHKDQGIDDTTFRVYFGDESNYEIERVFDGEFEKNDGYYYSDIKVLANCSSFKLELPKVEGIQFNHCEINSKEKAEIEIHNYYKIENKAIFYNDNPYITVLGDFNKGEEIKLRLSFIKLSISNCVEMLNDITKRYEKDKERYEKDKERYEKDKERYKEIESSYHQIMSSKSWRIICKIRKIKSKLF